MQLFEEINTLLSGQKPFVCYVKPNESLWNLQVQQTNEIIAFSGQSGFVFVTFDAGIKVCIPNEISTFSQGNFENLEQKLADSFTSEDNQKDAFENLVSKGIAAIQKGAFDKVVLSRKIVLKEQIALVATFQNLIATYPTAFRYLFFHPKIGLWMGATPEQLVTINQNQFETVALAGTQLFSESIIWTTKEIEEQQAALGLSLERHKAAVYPGTCRPGLNGKTARAWRFNVDKWSALRGSPVVQWHDRRLGNQSQNVLEEVGDFVLKRADGLWAYQLAVVVDDAAQGITHVVRGEDLTDNTARQYLLQEALGHEHPLYLHTPLVLGANGEKLSKQNGAKALDLSSATAIAQALQAAASTLGLTHLDLKNGNTAAIAAALTTWTQAWTKKYVVATP